MANTSQRRTAGRTGARAYAPGRMRGGRRRPTASKRWLCPEPPKSLFEKVLDALLRMSQVREEGASLQRGSDGLFIVSFIVVIAIGGAIGLVWMGLATAKQKARARMHKHRARKAGMDNTPPPPERLAVNGDVGPATLKEHWLKSFRSPMDALRAGSVLLDVECTVPARTLFKDGSAAGRSGGMKEWLARNAPYIPYATSMRYKRLAELYRDALGLAPGLPAEWFLPDCDLPASQINKHVRQFASKLRADRRLDPGETDCLLARIGTFTDESLARLREKGREFFARRDDSDTAGVEGVTRRLYAANGLFRRPVGPLRRRNAVRTRREPKFVPSAFRDHAYRDTPEGRRGFAVRCALRRDTRHRMFRGHLTNLLHRDIDRKLPDNLFAAHFEHLRRLSPLQVDPVCNPSESTGVPS